MPLSIAPASGPLNRTSFSPDEERPGSRRAPERHPNFQSLEPLTEPRFDSSAPVIIDSSTEAAVVDLEPVHEVPLATVINSYTDEADSPSS